MTRVIATADLAVLIMEASPMGSSTAAGEAPTI